MNNDTQSLTCSTCRHWHAKPRNTMDLSQPPRGDCREGPPHTTSLPGPNGSIGTLSTYPDLPGNFAACSRHEERRTSLEFIGYGEQKT